MKKLIARNKAERELSRPPKKMSASTKVLEPEDESDEEEQDDDDDQAPRARGRATSLDEAFNSVPLAPGRIEDGEYTGQLIEMGLEEFSQNQTVVIRAKLAIADRNEPFVVTWVMLKKDGSPNDISITRFRESIAVLGYKETAEERFTEENLDQIFEEVNDEKPWLKFRVSTSGEWQNTRFLKQTEPDD